MELLVLVGRDLRPGVRPALPSLHEPSPIARQASTRKAPEPIAGSQTLRSSTCSGVASGPGARMPALVRA